MNGLSRISQSIQTSRRLNLGSSKKKARMGFSASINCFSFLYSLQGWNKQKSHPNPQES